MASIVSAETQFTVEFPCGVLNYDPYVPRKRTITKQVTSGSFTQISDPIFLPGLESIEWTIKGALHPLAFSLLDAYNLEENYDFFGAWNEQYLVEFVEFDMISNSGRFDLSGKFRIICVDTNIESPCDN